MFFLKLLKATVCVDVVVFGFVVVIVVVVYVVVVALIVVTDHILLSCGQ